MFITKRRRNFNFNLNFSISISIFIIILTFYFLTFTTPKSPHWCEARFDFEFVLDGSGSISNKEFQTMKDFCHNFTSYFKISNNGAHVGIVQFSSFSRIELKSSSNRTEIEEKILSMDQLGGGTRIDLGIKDAMKDLNNIQYPYYVDPKKKIQKLIILTDGQAQGDPTSMAKLAKDNGTEIICIGIGNGINLLELQKISTQPNSTHVFTVKTFDDLYTIQKALLDKLCPTFPYGLLALFYFALIGLITACCFCCCLLFLLLLLLLLLLNVLANFLGKVKERIKLPPGTPPVLLPPPIILPPVVPPPVDTQEDAQGYFHIVNGKKVWINFHKWVPKSAQKNLDGSKSPFKELPKENIVASNIQATASGWRILTAWSLFCCTCGTFCCIPKKKKSKKEIKKSLIENEVRIN